MEQFPPGNPDTPSSFNTPPVTPGPVTRGASNRPSWPTVIGIIMTIFGVGGVLMGVWGILSNTVLVDLLMSMTSPEERAAIEHYFPWFAGISVLSTLLAALLLAAGIGMVKRRPWSAPASLLWSVMRIVMVFVTLTVTFFMQRDQFAAMQQSPNAPPLPDGFFAGMLFGTACFGLLWGLALPVFVLIWLTRAHVKREVAVWRGEATRPEAGPVSSPVGTTQATPPPSAEPWQRGGG